MGLRLFTAKARPEFRPLGPQALKDPYKLLYLLYHIGQYDYLISYTAQQRDSKREKFSRILEGAMRTASLRALK